MERGDSAVALGVYVRVMQVLRLDGDLARLAVDDILGRKLQDAGIAIKKRAPKGTALVAPKTVRLMNRVERIDDSFGNRAKSTCDRGANCMPEAQPDCEDT